MNRVEFVNVKCKTTICSNPDRWKFGKGDEGWRYRLATWAFNKLVKHGWLTNCTDETMTYERVSFDPKDIVEAVYMQIDDLVRRHQKPAFIVLGPKQFQELAYVAGPMMFRLSSALPVREFVGLTLEVIPWLDGMVVLPRLGVSR